MLELVDLMKVVWLAGLILFGIGEAATVGLTSIWFAAGSLAALIAALSGGPLWLQILLFLVVSLICLMLVRPLARKYLKPSYQPTNADRIIGTEAVVTQTIENLKGEGQVSVAGIPWSARSDDDSIIPAGSHVRILRIEGVKVFVEQMKEEVTC